MRGGRQSFVASDQGASRWEPSPHAPRGFATPVASVGVRVFLVSKPRTETPQRRVGCGGPTGIRGPGATRRSVRPRVAGNSLLRKGQSPRGWNGRGRVTWMDGERTGEGGSTVSTTESIDKAHTFWIPHMDPRQDRRSVGDSSSALLRPRRVPGDCGVPTSARMAVHGRDTMRSISATHRGERVVRRPAIRAALPEAPSIGLSSQCHVSCGRRVTGSWCAPWPGQAACLRK
jgi:hypothetical protein